MSTRSRRIALLLASGAIAALVVTVVPWVYYGLRFRPVASLSWPRAPATSIIIRDWSLKGPGGRYGITENFGRALTQTRRGFERNTQTWIWFGPLGRRGVPVRAPVAALGLAASTILLFGLGFYGILKLSDEKQTA